MSTQLVDLLGQWYSLKDATEWVLGTVYKTEGPAYRRAGAMMLFGGQGQQLGMLSGGCLETDISRHARQVMRSNKALTLTYDGTDEDDISFQLGIGCGGRVQIVLQPVHHANAYLNLDLVFNALSQRQRCHFSQLIPDRQGNVAAHFSAGKDSMPAASMPGLIMDKGQLWLHSTLEPPPHLLIAGGGVDARPVAAIARQLGWQVSLWDSRPANGRPEYFPGTNRLLRCNPENLADYAHKERVDAAILMTHNVYMDAQIIRAMAHIKLKYWALLGPNSRRQKVLSEADINPANFHVPLAGPAGLDIGTGQPETIALSILAECQAALNNRTGASLSKVLTQ